MVRGKEFASRFRPVWKVMTWALLRLSLCAVLALLFFVVVNQRAYAQEAAEPPGMEQLLELITQFVGASAIGPLGAAIIQAIKQYTNLIPDGKAGIWYACANVIMFVILSAAHVFNFDLNSPNITIWLDVALRLIQLLLPLLAGLFTFGKLRELQIPWFMRKSRALSKKY